MEQLEGRTAVVTGAASGIGYALSERFARAGMRVVMADVEIAALEEAAARLAVAGAEVLSVRTDVSDGTQVDELARRAAEAFGDVHVLCNNAGVGGGGMIAECTTADWEWVLGVNLWGVIHGLRAFLPGMIAHGEPAHVVNTASMAGLVTAPFMGAYCASKFAVVAISETLHHEMAMLGTSVGVSVLCPGWVNTRIHESDRTRPGGRFEGVDGEGRAALAEILKAGLDPADVAQQVEEAMRDGRFFVLTHPEMLGGVEARTDWILRGTEPDRAPGGVLGALLGDGVEEPPRG